MKKFLILTLVFIISFLSFQVKAQSVLPSVMVTTLDGKKINLADLGEKNKITLISFWATWCTPCKAELNNMLSLYPDWKKKDVEVVAISVDDQRNVAKVKSYVSSKKWPYTVLLDTNSDLKRALNFQSVPYTILVDRSGKIIYKHAAYTEGDEDVIDQKIKSLK